MKLSISAAARESPDRTALIADDGPRTFKEIASAVDKEIAQLRERGLRDGSGAAAWTARSTASSIVRTWALAEIGVAAAPLHPRLTPTERAKRVALIPEALDLDAEGDTATRPATDAQFDDETPLAILFTSGTMGQPRAVELSRRAFLASAAANAANLGWRDDDRWLCCLPLAHIGGLSIPVRCLVARRCVILARGRFDPGAIARRIKDDRVTLASVVPTMVRRLLGLRPRWRPPATLRAVLVGGAPAGPDLLREARDRGLPVLPTYGMTETCSQVATATPGDAMEPDAARPLPGIEVRADDGRIRVRGPVLFTRYLPAEADADPFGEDGWFDTGDTGRIDADGYLHVTGRRDDRIITGGENVDPRAVEEVIDRIPGIDGSVVFGIDDPEWGQVVAAAIVVAPGSRPDDNAIAARLAAALSIHARPRRVAYLDRLPLTPTGKPDRAAAIAAAQPLLRPLRYGTRDR